MTRILTCFKLFCMSHYLVERPSKTITMLFPERSIFLAGPTYRDGQVKNPLERSWRKQAIDYLAKKKFSGTIYAPEPFLGDYKKQIQWETAHLEKANVILFWIPRDLKMLPGFTTNIEFGEYLNSGKIILGYPKGAPKMKYLEYRARGHRVPVFHNLHRALNRAIERSK